MVTNSSTETELREELKEKRKELSALRTQLKTIYEQKEEQYKLLNGFRASSKSFLDQIKVLKGERDELTGKVRELKQQRDSFNTISREKSALNDEASKKKKELAEKLSKNSNSLQFSKSNFSRGKPEPTHPGEIKSLINKMEHRLETEVMPFPKEEQLRKQVKELQAKLKKMSELNAAWKASNATAADAADVRRKAQEMHQHVQKTADSSQLKHQQINSLYEQLKELREKEKPTTTQYLEFKNQSEQIKAKMQELQSRIHELSKLFDEDQKKNFKDKIKEKTAEVSEKIKKKEKLKMDDILAFQALDEN